ncbi:uncharacterized protein BKA78DRAFT_79397 [Phyllosticta capitalensis]|uniref:uncharacterized protein n=1 Tax=Phyllosticta capitalensis TaxID=121624 RepID=UPI003131A32A
MELICRPATITATSGLARHGAPIKAATRAANHPAPRGVPIHCQHQPQELPCCQCLMLRHIWLAGLLFHQNFADSVPLILLSHATLGYLDVPSP